MIQKLRTVTLTNGNIKDLTADCEQLNIRGFVTLHQEVRVKKISTHGHSSFHSRVEAQILNSTGSCTLKDFCEINEMKSAGSLNMRNGQVTKLNSSGKLTIEQNLEAETVDVIGIVKATEILAKLFHLKMSGESKIRELIADEICIEKDKISVLPLLKKKLICHCIKGKNVRLSYTHAEIVEGDVVIVGSNCRVKTLYYTDSYSIAPNAKVQQIVRREKE
ncbi:polymer-forming cytoskeletal protein [Lysinibacillus sp. CTST325]